MRIVCPRCGHTVHASKTRCRQCGFALTLGSVVRFYARRWFRRWQRAAVTRCPSCGATTPISAKHCKACGVGMTVQLAVRQTLAPARRRWTHFLIAFAPLIRWLLQGTYLAGSGWLFVWLLRQVLTQDLIPLLICAAVTALYVAVLALLALWIVPRPVQTAVADRTTAFVRLGLVFNGLSLVLGLEKLIAHWWTEALVLAGLIGVLVLAAFLLGRVLWPRAQDVRKVHSESQQTNFDPSAPQGRKAVTD